jgi:hypothetical protein
MSEELIKIIGFLFIIGFLLYVAVKWLKLHASLVEGLTNPSSATTGTGIGSSAANYAITLKNQVTQLHNDILLMNNKEYNKEYGNIILSMDDYINDSTVNIMSLKTRPCGRDIMSFAAKWAPREKHAFFRKNNLSFVSFSINCLIFVKFSKKSS